ncbi:MAG: replication factor C large subunit [Halobacteriales archaeon]
MADWTERYRPRTLEEVRGNDAAVAELREWATTWDDHREAVILHGPPGVGKTSSALALADERGWPVVELNASDQRTRRVIESIAGEAAKSGTLTAGAGGRRLIVLDEADNLHGNVDRGGTAAITRLVDGAGQPVVLIANAFYEMSRGLRNRCREIEFRQVTARSIVPVLRDICRKEGIDFEEAALERIAERTSGDLRSAIQDLQAIAAGRDELGVDDVVTGDRDRTDDIFTFLDGVIKELGPRDAQRAAYRVDETPDDLLAWLDENVPRDFDGAELADAYHHLSLADRWLGRVHATQNYTYWRYATNHLSAGVASARAGSKGGWTRYGPPGYRGRLGRSRGARGRRDAIARRIAEAGGMSVATARREVLPLVSAMTHHCKPRAFTEAVAAAFELDASEVSHLTGSGEETKKVARIVEHARVGEPEVVVEEAADDDPEEAAESAEDAPTQSGLGDFG